MAKVNRRRKMTKVNRRKRRRQAVIRKCVSESVEHIPNCSEQ